MKPRSVSLFRSALFLLPFTLLPSCGAPAEDDDGGAGADCADLGRTTCGTSCVDTSTDTVNCGQCGVACPFDSACTNGSCLGAATGGASGVGGTVNGVGGVTASGGVSSSGGTVSAGGSLSTGGTGSDSTGVEIDGACRPLCASADSDPDGDGWGWENEASCVVVGSAPYAAGTPCDVGGSGGGTSTGGVGTGGTSTGGAASGGAGTGGTSTGGTGTGGSGSGGTGGTTCGVAPVNANASPQAKKLLCYLYDIYGKSVLSGQQETSWSNPQNDISWYNTNTGKYPALLGGDYLYPNGTSTRAISYFNAGGVVMIRYHMGAPPNSDTYENSMGTANIGNVLTQGTAEYNSFISKLNYVGDELQKLEDANVAVLWAPFHEVQPNGWFWWSKGTAQQFKQLWTMMFNHLTTTRGLNNLVWLMPFSGSPSAAWLPEKQYYDLSGPDTYATNPPFASMFNTAKGIIGGAVPIPLHETGVVPQPSSMFPSTAPWVLWNIWAGYQISNNSLQNIQSAYSSPYTITRDELPNLK